MMILSYIYIYTDSLSKFAEELWLSAYFLDTMFHVLRLKDQNWEDATKSRGFRDDVEDGVIFFIFPWMEIDKTWSNLLGSLIPQSARCKSVPWDDPIIH